MARSGRTRSRRTAASQDQGPRRTSAIAFDEYPLWLETISRVAESAGVEIIGTATQAHEAIAMLQEKRPKLFILGLDRTAAKPDDADPFFDAVSEVGQVSTIVVSNDGDPEFIDYCLSRGATAYALKTIRPDDLSSTIRQAANRCVYLFGMPKRRHDGELKKLTARELEVLLLVADGLSNAEVARHLWISVATVKFHLMKTYEKLGVTNRTGAVRSAQRHGLLTAESGATPHPRRRQGAASSRQATRRGHSLSRS